MVRSKGLLADLQPPAVELQRFVALAFFDGEAGQIEEAERQVGMLGPQNPLADFVALLVITASRRQIFETAVDEADAVEVVGGIGMLGPQALLGAFLSSQGELPGLFLVTPLVLDQGDPPQAFRQVHVVGLQGLFTNSQGAVMELTGAV